MEHAVLTPAGVKKASLTLPVSTVQLGTGSKTIQRQVTELPSNFSSARIFKLPPGVVLVKPTLGTIGVPVLSKKQAPVIRLETRRLVPVPVQPKPAPKIVANPDYKPENVRFHVQPKPIVKKPPVVSSEAKSNVPKEPTEDSVSANNKITDCSAPNASSDGGDQSSKLKPKPTPWGRDPRPLWKSKEPIVMYSGCSKEDLEEALKKKRKKELPPESLPCPKVLDDILPKSYKYHISSFEELRGTEHFKAEIRTTLTKKDEALQWLKDFEDVSGTNFRITKTFKENSLRIIFKKCYKCHKNTFRKGQQQSKRHLGCEARLSITVKNTGMKSSADPLLSEFPCVIGLYHNHCHSLKTPDGLRHRRTLPEIREKFADMFRAKITPAAALKVHKADLKREYGAKFEEVVNDGAKCPPLPWCYRLYYEICGKKVKDGKKKSTRRSYSSSKKKVVVHQTIQSSIQRPSADSVIVDFNSENCLNDRYAMDNPKSKPDDEMQRSINSLYGYDFMSKSNIIEENELSKGVPSNRTDVIIENPELVEATCTTELLTPEVIYQNDTAEDYSDPNAVLNEDDNIVFEETCDTMEQDDENDENNQNDENNEDYETSERTAENSTECSIMELKQGLNDFCTYLLNRVSNNPALFLPAVETFISTFNKVCETSSDTQLAEEFLNFGKNITKPVKQITPSTTSGNKAQKHKLLESRPEISTIVEGLTEQSQNSCITDMKPETSSPKRKVLVLRMKPNKFNQILGKVEEKRLRKGVINI